MRKKTIYNRQELINELNRYIKENGKLPRYTDLSPRNGYISVYYYYTEFGTLNDALIEAGFKPIHMYRHTKEMIREFFLKFVNEFGRVPTEYDFENNPEYPSACTVIKICGSWNNGLKYSGLPINKMQHKDADDDKCSICGSKITVSWNYRNGKWLCNKCSKTNRLYYHGITDPNSTIGIGIITEHIIYIVLDDCEKCNTEVHFNEPFDLISKRYGTINVKASTIRFHSGYNWDFAINPSSQIPDYYICIGFNENKTKIKHVWFIPNTAKLIAKRSITIVLNNLERASQYEVDPTPYNEAYQNLDIYTLPEFCNLPRDDILHRVPSEDMIKC